MKTKISEAENKIPDTSNKVTTTSLNTKINEAESKIPNHDKCITTEFNKLAAKNFAARLKQANLVTKSDFNDKLTSFTKRITSNKTKHLEVQKKLNNLITKDYDFFLVRTYVTSNDGSQNMFISQHLVC